MLTSREAHDDGWQVTADRRYLSEYSVAQLREKNARSTKEVARPELITA